MIYKAKKDKEIYLFPIMMMMIVVILKVYKNDFDVESILVFVLLSSVIVLFVLFNMITIEYVLGESELIIRTGMFKTVLKLEQIVKIEQSKGIYSFSSSSREQLKLTYISGRVISISPLNLIEFEEHLNKCIKNNSGEKGIK